MLLFLLDHVLLSTDKPEPWPSLISPGIIDNLVTTITLPLGSVIGSLLVFLPRILGLTNDLLGNPVIKSINYWLIKNLKKSWNTVTLVFSCKKQLKKWCCYSVGTCVCLLVHSSPYFSFSVLDILSSPKKFQWCFKDKILSELWQFLWVKVRWNINFSKLWNFEILKFRPIFEVFAQFFAWELNF